MRKIIICSAVVGAFFASTILSPLNAHADQVAVSALSQSGVVLSDEEYFSFLSAQPEQLGEVAAAVLIERAKIDTETLANIVGTLVAEFPLYAVSITESVVNAYPTMAAVIVAAAVKAAPLQAAEIVAAAVAVAPAYARAIVAAAVAIVPQMAQKIVQAAIKAAPEQSAAINAGSADGRRQATANDTSSGPSAVTPTGNESKSGGGGDTNAPASPS